MRHQRVDGTAREDGCVTLGGAPLVVVALLVLVLTLDVGSYLTTASRAQASADAAALAAAAAPVAGGDAAAVAARVARTAGGRVERCDCHGPVVRVEVSLAVRSLAVGRFAPARVSATAEATLTPRPSRVPPGGRTLTGRNPSDPRSFGHPTGLGTPDDQETPA